MVGADKSGMLRMLDGEGSSYRYTRQICELLGVDEPMVENPAITQDEWDRAVALARSLPLEQQRRALRILRAVLDEENS